MSEATRSEQPLMACQECDLLQRIPPLPIGGRARCARCGFVLAARPSDPLELPLVLTLTALIVFVVANAMPLMDLCGGWAVREHDDPRRCAADVAGR
ncbi:MAG: hypothetical protein KDI53_01760 [Candidatus Accumulibacter sp.]|nr:hypothetical protein [Accumulibacter sp.]